MGRPSEKNITRLLRNWAEGDQSAWDEVYPLVEIELRRLAQIYISREAPHHTLQATELITEAYLRLAGAENNINWQDRNHFFAVSATIMRHILVDYARKHRRRKAASESLDNVTDTRKAASKSLNDVPDIKQYPNDDIIAVDEALCHLAKYDLRKCTIVELLYFCGLSIKDTAKILKISPSTVRREWKAAKAWLYLELSQK